MTTILSLFVGLLIANVINYFVLKKDIKTMIVSTLSAFIMLVVLFYFSGRIHF